MKEIENILNNRVNLLSEEMETLSSERVRLIQRIEEIDVRVHQIAGSLYEFNIIINQVNQLSDLHGMQVDLESSEKK